MAVVAVQQIRRMRGGAQSHLMLGSDHELYVVKFQNNPQHVRVLANEFFATKIAEAVGIIVPACDIIEVSPWLIENTPELRITSGHGSVRCTPGLQYGSRYAGSLMPGQLVDYLPEEQMGEVRNLADFAGMLVLDKWTGNANGRQAVYLRKPRERKYRAIFIDHGYCFGAGTWTFADTPLRGVYGRNSAYANITGWDDFEPWLSRVENFDVRKLWEAAEQIPPEWYGHANDELERLVATLMDRRSRIREWIDSFRTCGRNPFPQWGNGPRVGVEGFRAWTGMGSTVQ